MERDQLLLRTENFHLFAGVGPLAEGYIIIAPHLCDRNRGGLRTMADASAALLDELIFLTGIVVRFYRETYDFKGALFFEHGKAGTCGVSDSPHCYHAHLCCFHVSAPIWEDIDVTGKSVRELKGLNELAAAVGENPHLLIHECLLHHESPPMAANRETWRTHVVVLEGENDIPRQYLRKLLASRVGTPHRWDWAGTPGIAAVKALCAKFRDWLESQPRLPVQLPDAGAPQMRFLDGVEAVNARAYDALAHDFHATWGQELTESMAAITSEFTAAAMQSFRSRPRPPSRPRLLDAGCGPGLYLQTFRNAGFDCVGTDRSTEMLNIASRDLNTTEPTGGGATVELANRNAFLMADFAEQSFDAIWFSALLVHLPRCHFQSVVENLNRLLHPGGILFLSAQSGGDAVMRTDGRFFVYYTQAELEEAFRRVGFRVLKHWSEEMDFGTQANALGGAVQKKHWNSYLLIKSQPAMPPAIDSMPTTHHTVGIVTALPLEYAAVLLAFDIPLGATNRIPGKGGGRHYHETTLTDSNGNSCKVLIFLAGKGNNSASRRAALILDRFPEIDLLLMTGIACGIPSEQNPERDMKLGDIAVSSEHGVIKYDFIADKNGVPEYRGVWRPPSATALNAVDHLQVDQLLGNSPWEAYIQFVLKRAPWARRPSGLGRSKVVSGPIAAADILLRNAEKRDALQKRFNVIAVEMESSGIAEAAWEHERSYLTIRGICDYGDSLKSDLWQPYAAVAAAGYARALVDKMFLLQVKYPETAVPPSSPENEAPAPFQRYVRSVCVSHDRALLRSQSLWKVAYSFFRLDQLQSGGWGKSLPQWMEAALLGETGTITRSSDMRRLGGLAFTCNAFYQYTMITDCLLGNAGVPEMLRRPTQDRLRRYICSRIDPDSSGLPSQLHRSPVNLRGTALGIIALLQCNDLVPELQNLASYLVSKIETWNQDKSYPFGMFAAFSKLADILGAEKLNGLTKQDRDKLLSAICSNFENIGRSVVHRSDYTPLPIGTCTCCEPLDGNLRSSSFLPYSRLWKLERSGFLTYLPLLLADDGNTFGSLIEDNKDLKSHLAGAIARYIGLVLREIKVPFAAACPSDSLLGFHCGLLRHNDSDETTKDCSPDRRCNIVSPRDWGATAQLLALVNTQIISDVLVQNNAVTEEALANVREAMQAALLVTFDGYYRTPGIFRFTHSLSFFAILRIFPPELVPLNKLRHLDDGIAEVARTDVTEQSLDKFVRKHIDNLDQLGELNRIAVRDFLLQKLQAGEYYDEPKQIYACWDQIKQRTIDFYNSEDGIEYSRRYDSPVNEYVNRVVAMFERGTGSGLRALDLACGPGQYAELLHNKEFTVDLLDASEQMLEQASNLLKIARPPCHDFFQMERWKGKPYDLIFANAMMVHVPRLKAPGIYRDIFRLLKPGGILFINYKIGDHAGIAADGRFFAYYRDAREPAHRLREAGFKIDAILELWNDRNFKDLPHDIHWVNFFCVKPGSLAADVSGKP